MSEHIELPSNVEAERALLCIFINEPSSLNLLDLSIYPEDLFLERHQVILSSLFDLSDSGRQIDIISLVEQLASAGELERSGGAVYVSELSGLGISGVNVSYYVELIIEKSQRRALLELSQTLQRHAPDPREDVSSILENTEKNIFTITDRTQHFTYQPFSSIGKKVVEIIQERDKQEHEGTLRGIPTGYHRLDALLSGLQNGEFVIIGARPSIGKTAFALNLINNICFGNKIAAGFFSLEMSDIDIIGRLISMRTGINSSRIRSNNLYPDDFTKISQKILKNLDDPLFISDVPSMSLFDIRIQARRLVIKEGVKIIFIDYLGLIDYTRRDDVRGLTIPRFEKVTEISRSLKALARELYIPIVALSQVNRDSEGREPTLANIRDSGSIEQDADVVMFLHRESRDDNATKLIVAKQRNGPVDSINFNFDAKTLNFFET